MNLRKRLLAAASALTLFAGVGFLASAPVGALTSFNVANDHVTCNTLSGTVKFLHHLTLSGPTTGAQTITITAAVSGCFDDDNSNVHMFKGAIAATQLTSNNGWNCSGLAGLSSQTATTNVTWTPAAGQTFTPTTGSPPKKISVFSLTQTNSGIFTVPSGQGPWTGDGYGEFQVGTAFGTAAPSVTSEFTGGDGGSTSWFTGTTQQDIVNILTQCGATAGVASVNFGIGAVHLG